MGIQFVSSQNSGNHDQFKTFFTKYYMAIYHFFRRKNLEEAECEDLVQTVFLKTYESLLEEKIRHLAFPFLLKVADSTWKNWIRDKKASKRYARHVSVNEVGENEMKVDSELPIINSSGNPFQETAAKEELSFLKKEIRSLPVQMRRCLIHYFLFQRKYKEIALVLPLMEMESSKIMVRHMEDFQWHRKKDGHLVAKKRSPFSSGIWSIGKRSPTFAMSCSSNPSFFIDGRRSSLNTAIRCLNGARIRPKRRPPNKSLN